MVEIVNLFLVAKYQRYYLKHKVINRTERGLENKEHSAAIIDVFLPSWMMQNILPGLLPQTAQSCHTRSMLVFSKSCFIPVLVPCRCFREAKALKILLMCLRFTCLCNCLHSWMYKDL